MISLIKNICLILHSARIILWPAILVNATIVAYSASTSVQDALLIGLSLCCVASYGFIINDCKDVQVDKINRSGRLECASEKELLYVQFASVGFLVVSLILAIVESVMGFSTIGLIGLGLTIYTFYARQKLFFATILAAILSSTPLWIPSVIFNSLPSFSQVLVIVVSLILLLGREIVFDTKDYRGDFYGKRRTFATVFSRKFALNLSSALNTVGAILLVLLAIGSKWIGHQTPFYSWMSILGVLLFLLLLLPPIFKLKYNPESHQHFEVFTQRSRLAMLLLPVFWLVF